MKAITSLLVLLLLASSSFSQKQKKSKKKAITTFEINYIADIEATSEDAQMMVMFLEGAELKLATDGKKTYVRNTLGMMGVQETLIDAKSNEMTMYMSGMMEAAYKGNMDELDEETNENSEVQYSNETKVILGIKCKKAFSIDAEAGSESIYWYSEKYAPSSHNSMVADGIPGLCLEMIIKGEGYALTYTATELNEKVSMSNYSISIPEGVEVQPLSEMGNLGQ